jgi:flagellar hook-associated protein 1
MVSSIFHIGQSGLRAGRTGVRVASENVANVNTPGYHRRVTVLQASRLRQVGNLRLGLGVEVRESQRVVDEALDRRLRSSIGQAAAQSSRSDVLDRANVILGDLEGAGVSSTLDEFFASLDLLAASPEDRVSRSNVLASAERFAESVNDVGRNLRAMRQELDPEVEAGVDEVNRLAAEVASLNEKISSRSRVSNDLLDRRARLVDQLSETVGATVIPGRNDVWNIAIEGGYTLVSGSRVQGLSTRPGVDGFVRIEGIDGAGTPDLTDRIRQGQLGGLLVARDEDLGATAQAYDDFVTELVNEVNARHSAGYGLDGVTGRNLFAPPAAVNPAENLAVDPAVAANPDAIAAARDPALLPGDNRAALDLAEVRLDPLASGQEPPDALRQVLQEFGDRAFAASASAESATLAADQLTNLQQSVSGVSVDEELATLMQFRQQFSAAATVIQTADELTREIIGLKG